MATTKQEAKIEAAERAKIKLTIAYRLHFEKGKLSAIAALQRERSESHVFSYKLRGKPNSSLKLFPIISKGVLLLHPNPISLAKK